jgi:catechol 2,3-dioxygenase-like lactoylglutathione lyase family enzyme
MSGVRIDNVLIVVDDLDPVIEFFSELGMEVDGRANVGGSPVDRLIGLDGVSAEIVSIQTPDGQGRIELDKFHTPAAVRFEPNDAPMNTLGLRRIMFAVDDIDEVVVRLQTHGAELVGEVVQYEDHHRLAYVRGPEGIVVGLAEEIR